MVKAAGTPTPEVLWFKNEAPVQIQPGHIGIFNDGTELRISGLQNNDIGDYTCIARNGEGRIHHTTKLVKAGKRPFQFTNSFVVRKLTIRYFYCKTDC